MDRLEQRYSLLQKALDSLESSIEKLDDVGPSDFYFKELRDSTIQRFEYSVDTFWKYLKEMIGQKHGIETQASPKAVFKQAFDLKEISKKEHDNLKNMIEDRNLTSHADNEELADKISQAIPNYFQQLKSICNKLKS